MPDKKAVRGNLAEHRRLRIVVLFFRRLECSLLFCAAAFVVNANVVECHVFDIVAGDAADDRGVSWFGVIDDDVAECDATQRANRHSRWSTHPPAKPQKDWTVGDVAHRDV